MSNYLPVILTATLVFLAMLSDIWPKVCNKLSCLLLHLKGKDWLKISILLEQNSPIALLQQKLTATLDQARAHNHISISSSIFETVDSLFPELLPFVQTLYFGLFSVMLSDIKIRFPSYGIYISQLVRFARCCTSVLDFHSKNLQVTSKTANTGL